MIYRKSNIFLLILKCEWNGNVKRVRRVCLFKRFGQFLLLRKSCSEYQNLLPNEDSIDEMAYWFEKRHLKWIRHCIGFFVREELAWIEFSADDIQSWKVKNIYKRIEAAVTITIASSRRKKMFMFILCIVDENNVGVFVMLSLFFNSSSFSNMAEKESCRKYIRLS